MELTIEQALQQGLAAHKEGKLQEAERLYRAILQSQPLHPDANHNLGLIAVSVNQAGEALSFFKVALDANPKIEQFWLSYIETLINEKQFETAKQVLGHSKKQGVVLKKLNVLAEQLFSRNEPKNISSRNSPQEQANNILEHYHKGRLEETEKLALSFTQEFSRHPFGWKILALVLKHTGRMSEALMANQNSVQLDPQDAEAHNNLGNIFKNLGRADEAEASYTQALELKPDYAEAHNNLGNTLINLGRVDEAELSYNRAIKLKSDFTEALMNRWQLFFDRGQYSSALKDVDSCNTRKSRACGLETLYQLGRIDEIYNRIELQSEAEDGNLRMAAFSAFISKREKRDTAHKFCQNPLSFVHFTNISSQIKESSKFIKELTKELNEVKTVWEPDGRTTKKGYQTPTGVNLFTIKSEKIIQLNSIIANELDEYYLKFSKESCSYIKKWPTQKKLFGWHVVLKQQGYQRPHIHESGWLSGVVYLKVVPSLEKNEGAIEFSLNSQNYSDASSPKLIFQPELGDIVFFPSSLHHRTIPFTTSTDRIIVSFDLIPEKP